MKYILEENIRHILSERFILNEAIKFDTLIEQSKAICDNIKTLLKDLNGETGKDEDKEGALDKIFNRTTTLRQDIRNVKDVELIKGKAKDYIDTIRNLILTVDPSTFDAAVTVENKTTDFGKFFAHLKDLIDNSKTKKAELVAELGKIDSLIQLTKDNLANITNSANQTKTKDDQVVDLTKAYKLIFKVSQANEKEYNDNETISGVIEDLAKEIPNKTKFIDLCSELVKKNSAAAKIIDSMSVENYNSTDLETSLKKDTDWDALYKKTPDKDLLWESYYTGAWGKNASKIKMLGEAFKQECVVLGFTEASNPFISFIKKYIIDNNYYIDTAHYEAIHNAIAQNKLSRRDITDKPKDPITITNNIIFYKDFYNKPEADAVIYLNALSKLRDIDVNKLVLENEVAQKNIVDCSGGDNKVFIAVILSNKIPLTELVSKDATLSPITPNIEDKLRPVQDLNQLLVILNANGTNKEAWDATSTNKLVAGIKETFKGDEAAYAKKIICYIADSQDTDDAKIQKLNELSKKYSWFEPTSKSLTTNQKVKIITELNRYGGDIDWKMLDNIIKMFEKEENPKAAGKSWLDTPITPAK